MRIVHLSDPHLLDLHGVAWHRWFNKRATGWLNLKLHRGSVHKREVVEAMMDDVRATAPDHVVVTGDVTNLALENEFELAASVLSRLGLPGDRVSVVPGNHDVYTRGAQRDGRFLRYLGQYASSDVELGAVGAGGGPFPFVRLRGDVALIGLSTAVARLPLVAAGHAGRPQLRALEAILEMPEVARRTPVVLLHHPLVNPPKALSRWMRGLREAAAIRAILRRRSQAIVLHGHLHDRAHRVLGDVRGAVLHHVGATSASLLHHAPDRVASYNVYEIDGDGLGAIRARVYDAQRRVFVDGVVRRVETSLVD